MFFIIVFLRLVTLFSDVLCFVLGRVFMGFRVVRFVVSDVRMWVCRR